MTPSHEWRLALIVPPTQIHTVTPPPALSAVLQAAPESWRPTLDQIGELAATYSVDARIFGSLAWQSVTELDYLTKTSDLDVLFYTHRDTDLRALAKGLAKIDARSPMRIDGEFVRNDGAAVNWREFHSGAAEILIKTLDGVAFIEASGFALGRLGQ